MVIFPKNYSELINDKMEYEHPSEF